MSRPLIAVASLTKKSVTERIQLGEVVTKSLTDHPTIFVTPSPAIAMLTQVTDELREADAEAGTGSHEGRQRLAKALPIFQAAIGEYQTYVNLVAKGNGVIIEQSGLQASRPAQKAGPMPAPTGLTLNGSIARQLTATVDAVEKAKAYIWEYYEGDMPPATDKAWHLACGTPTAKAVIGGLTPKTTVWVRGAAIGTKGQGPWSAPVSDNVR